MVNLRKPGKRGANPRETASRAGASAPWWTRLQFVLAAHELRQLPADRGAEVAVAGRSNAGKSSAINAITAQAKLARTSKTPGRTQQLVVFELDRDHRVVDLPGYGYAKVPPQLRDHWRATIDRYFATRRSLRGLLLAMDSRHPLTEFDTLMLEYCAARGLPCHVLLTKADKLTHSESLAVMRLVSDALGGGPETASAQLFSVPKKIGIDSARAVLANWLGLAES
ncbi:MAG TPA: ribosome biogenesis GTP-binding protein YihA/YsxC [Xanthomonadales bacterium]|nr:ribosome biogenesis GTP-binding protein YihA/YsxC [Xanthomonadales bacterium]